MNWIAQGLADPDSTLLTATNVALGVACGLLALAVLGSVIWENVARRVLRASLPDAWPPVPDEPGPRAAEER
jgi:hypothetical protein